MPGLLGIALGSRLPLFIWIAGIGLGTRLAFPHCQTHSQDRKKGAKCKFMYLDLVRLEASVVQRNSRVFSRKSNNAFQTCESDGWSLGNKFQLSGFPIRVVGLDELCS